MLKKIIWQAALERLSIAAGTLTRSKRISSGQSGTSSFKFNFNPESPRLKMISTANPPRAWLIDVPKAMPVNP